MPVALKDNLCTRGVRTTASSRMLETFVPPYDATVVSRLEAAGAVVVGKTNCDEFAMGSSTENSAFGPSRNPWALDRIPGGSSGGSAVAVAAGMTPLALGSDTGGSIRQPAALCGVVGLKPTYGRVSRYGLLAFASSLDQIGPLTRTVARCGARARRDRRRRSGGRDERARAGARLRGGADRRRPRRAHRRARRGCSNRASTPRSRARSRRRSTCWPRAARRSSTSSCRTRSTRSAVYYLVATAEASSNLARYDGVRYGFRAHRRSGKPDAASDLRTMYARTRERGFGAEVKRRIMLGTYVLSAGYYDAYYLKAQQVRTLIRRDYDAGVRARGRRRDADEPDAGLQARRARRRSAADVSRRRLHRQRQPGRPAGDQRAVRLHRASGLPIGLQLTGRRFDEATLLRVADAYERDTGWWKQTDPIEILAS